jgi:hypothetical protein
MWTTDDHTVAAGHSVTAASRQARLEELLGRVAHRFGRPTASQPTMKITNSGWSVRPDRMRTCLHPIAHESSRVVNRRPGGVERLMYLGRNLLNPNRSCNGLVRHRERAMA